MNIMKLFPAYPIYPVKPLEKGTQLELVFFSLTAASFGSRFDSLCTLTRSWCWEWQNEIKCVLAAVCKPQIYTQA